MLLSAFSATLLIAGCAAPIKLPPPPPPPPPPATISGTVQASADVNPSVSKRPSPVLIRVYELRTATAFNSADFISLFQKDQAELAADLVARDEFMLNPGETRPITKTLSNDTRFIAVFAAFRDIERANWRTVVPVQANSKHDLTINANGLVLSAKATVVPPPPPALPAVPGAPAMPTLPTAPAKPTLPTLPAVK